MSMDLENHLACDAAWRWREELPGHVDLDESDDGRDDDAALDAMRRRFADASFDELATWLDAVDLIESLPDALHAAVVTHCRDSVAVRLFELER